MAAPAIANDADNSLLERITARFLPEDFGDDPEQHFRARVVVAIALLIGCIGPSYGVVVYFLTAHMPIVIVTVLASLGVAITPLLMRRGASFVVQANWMSFCGCGLFVFVASQEILGPAVLLWQVVYVVLIALLAGRRTALTWLVLMSGATAYFYLSIISGAEGGEIVVSTTEVLFEMILIVGMFLTVMLLMLSSQRFKDWALGEVQRQEAHTRAILEAAPDGIVTLSEERGIGEFNAAAEQLFGYQRGDVEQAPMVSLIPEIEEAPQNPVDAGEEDGDSSVVDVADREAPSEGLQRWVGETYEAQAVQKDGQRFPAELSVMPIETEDRFVAIIRDITERKRAQKALRKARDKAVEANEAKSRFLANISHELRTPLNAIIGYSELVEGDLEQIGEDDMADDIGKIETAGRHLLDLINEILDLSKVEAGKMEIYVEEIDVKEVVEEIAQTLQPVIADNGNTLRIDVEDAPETMRVDRMKFRQILINLLSNASKFTENGLVRVNVFCEKDDGRQVGVFEIIDRGIGIPEDELDDLFEAFNQVDDSTTREFGGTGLGLTICKHFSELMGGDIAVESKVGEGSTFRVKIPVDVDEARRDRGGDDGDDKESLERSPSNSEIPPEAERVLVIDDDTTVHRLIERFLADEGFAVETTTGGEQVLETVRKFQPHIITLDVRMPEIDGWRILERLKSDPQCADIPVVMLTILNERNTGFSLGATDYLTKPVDPQQLIDVLHSNIDNGRTGPVMIVEDDDDIRELMRRNVEEAGFEVRCARDGQQALEMLDDVEPGAMLLDLMMPRVDGFEVLEQMRDGGDDDIPVIIVSAAELSEAEREMLEQNTEQVLGKGGLTKEQLIEELRDALGDRRRAPAAQAL